MTTDDHLDKWVLNIMQSELAQRQNDGVLAVRDRRGHPARTHAGAADRALAA